MERGGQLDQVLQQRPGEVLKLAGIENNDFLANNQQGCTKLAEIGCGVQWSWSGNSIPYSGPIVCKTIMSCVIVL